MINSCNMEALKAIKYYKKKKSTLYAERDEEKRTTYCNELKTIPEETIVYVDEAGVDDKLFKS